LWWWALTAGIPVIYLVLLSWFSGRVGVDDYDQFRVFDELQYWNANLFGAPKQWTPLLCAGLSMAGEPQIPFLSLTMAFSYVLGPVAGILAGTLAYLTIGWVGAYLYSGLWQSDRGQRALAASLFIGNGFFIVRLAHGHIDFVPFLILPLALWMVHVHASATLEEMPWARRVLGMLLLGAMLALAVDGSPVSIIHLVVWVGLYAVVLSWVRRSWAPIGMFVGACAAAAMLDAGYLWPMVNAQSEFPRRTPDTFTGPWALVWFLLLPHRGKVLPSNGTGIELSVFIGPFIALLIWRFRGHLQRMPVDMRVPLIAVSVASIVLGMGSLHSIGVPAWASPFDWVRPLPGFRSMNVTGRYWGFLALPLSLAGAAALTWYAGVTEPGRPRTLFLAATVLTQLIFQAQSVSSAWSHSRRYEQPQLEGIYSGGPQAIERVYIPTSARRHHHLQGETLAPTRAVINCYDLDDFKRAPVTTGAELIKDVQYFSAVDAATPLLRGDFITWNRIRITAISPADTAGIAMLKGTVRITLNQAFHTDWSSQKCAVVEGSTGNLTLDCPVAALSQSIELTFYDGVSALGARVSLTGWLLFPCCVTLLGLASIRPRRTTLTDVA
jgi:hypothetical protein